MLGLENVDLAGEPLSSSSQNRAANLASTRLPIGSSLSLQMFVLAIVLTFSTEFLMESSRGLAGS